MMNVRIEDIAVDLVSMPVPRGIADATRRVTSVGLAVVRVATDQGVSGIGVTYHEFGGEAVKELILKGIAPNLIGRDPFETESLWYEAFHYMRGVGRKGLAYCAYSAVDIALWDIKGKLLQLPLFRLLGGRREKLPIYASGGWTSYSVEELLQEASEMLQLGYRSIKVKVGVNGGRDAREDIRRIRALRDFVGEAVEIMVDANNVWQSSTAVTAAWGLQELGIKFLEEPVCADDIPGLAQFKAKSPIPVATGEHEYTKYGARDLLIHQAVDILQCDVTRCGGITELMKIIGMAQAWNIAVAPHAMEHMHMHLLASADNGLFLERLLTFDEVTEMVFKDPPQPRNGYLHIPDLPGLGLELNEEGIREYRT